MKILSAILFIFSSRYAVAANTGIRGAAALEKEEGMQHQSTRDLAGNDGKNLFEGHTNPGEGKQDEGFPVGEEESLIPNDHGPYPETKLLADQLGLSLEETQEFLQQQGKFSRLVDGMQEDINFLQAEMPDKLNGDFVIKFKDGKMSTKRQDAIKKFQDKNANMKVKTAASKLSLKDAQNRGRRLVDKLEEKGYSVASFSIDGDGIQVAAKTSKGQNRQLQGKAKGVISKAHAAEILEMPEDHDDMDMFSLLLAEDDDEDLVVHHRGTYGGTKIWGTEWKPDDHISSDKECTTGFIVQNITNGKTGFVTAGHCYGMHMIEDVEGWTGRGYYGTRMQLPQHVGKFGDVEWHTTWETDYFERAEFFGDRDEIRDVYRVQNSISKGQYVIGRSRATAGPRWMNAPVLNPNFSVNINQFGWGWVHNLVLMSHSVMRPGDSGAPWFYYNTAFGIHSGNARVCDGEENDAIIKSAYQDTDYPDPGDEYSNPCRHRDFFSRASLLPKALGVKVRTKECNPDTDWSWCTSFY